MQTAQMVATQRGSVQARMPVRAASFGSVNAIRGAPMVAHTPAQTRSLPALRATVVAAAATEEATEAVAHLRFSRGSPLKVRRVLDQIRGRSYEEALMILEYMPYKACEPVVKTLLSAAANAKHNMGMKKKNLVVTECFADGGPILKRMRPRAQSRAAPIHKPTVHITIKVAEKSD